MGGVTFNTNAQLRRLRAIKNLMKDGGASVEQVAALLGVARETAVPYLAYLRDCGEAHRLGSGRWVEGPSLGWVKPEKPEPEAPKVTVVHTDANYSSRVARRDPLVEALFGPAKA